MGKTIGASVVINNRNYGRFLSEAIESALTQRYPHTEVIVVDDGSEDDSRAIIARYAERVTPVFKENGGQGSAFNAGLAASTGEVILFLDADDMLLPTAVAKAVAALRDPAAVKVHWQLRVVDENGNATGQLRPGGKLPAGDLREAAFRLGPTQHLSAPTSGNAWARWYLERIFPVPELFRQGADTYLFELAPFFGPIRRIDEPQSLYRKHGGNFHAKMTMAYKLQRQTAFYELCVARLQHYCQESGPPIDLDCWRHHSWWHRHAQAVEEIAALPKAERALILVDEATWEAGPIDGRRRIPFLEKDGQYYGAPPDDATAITELDRLRRAGAAFLIFAWPAFWWFDHFCAFTAYLRTTYPCVLENERLVVFEL